MGISVIIVAAGESKRFLHVNNKTHPGIKKQFIKINGKPLLYWTIEKFHKIKVVDEIVIVLPEKDINKWAAKIQKRFCKVKAIVSGGNTRVDSVKNGLDKISVKSDIVIIHDGVRPLVEAQTFLNSISAAKNYGASIVAIPVRDTLKLADNKRQIIKTVDRANMWQAQTPQVFKTKLIKGFYDKINPETVYYITDDAQVLERNKIPVKIVPGSYLNIKITTKEDLKILKHFLVKQSA